MGYKINVLMLVGCSGNINHFDVSHEQSQTNYNEATRIGNGYAEIVLEAFPKLARIEDPDLSVLSREVEIPFRDDLNEKDISEAEKILNKTEQTASSDNLTSEALAENNHAVSKFFAEQLIQYHKNCSGKSRKFKIIGIKLSKDTAFISLPGEPFTEIGMAIKKRSPFQYNFIISNAMGRCGYIPLADCFGRGGYETLPVIDGAPSKDTAELLEAESSKILLQIKS